MTSIIEEINEETVEKIWEQHSELKISNFLNNLFKILGKSNALLKYYIAESDKAEVCEESEKVLLRK